MTACQAQQMHTHCATPKPQSTPSTAGQRAAVLTRQHQVGIPVPLVAVGSGHSGHAEQDQMRTSHQEPPCNPLAVCAPLAVTGCMVAAVAAELVLLDTVTAEVHKVHHSVDVPGAGTRQYTGLRPHRLLRTCGL
jgi:hypothetical protein